ncbi:golgin subfamily A member 5-like [Pollicipes pollicipes]|uniref:golgin subfamily A member 5-like n=1 Tax=Pollicipes pollicipes TaxID=41117 RepID=UPI0018854DF3|nr:golgin subfamily A member 5-like [Pollicipes pollicipes]
MWRRPGSREEAVRALESQLQKSAHAWSREQDDLLGQKKQQAQQQLEEHRAELERLRGEASSHGQLSRSSVGALHTDISRLRTQMEDKAITHEKEVASLSHQILDAQRQRDLTDAAHGQVKVKLKVTEEHRDRLERDLTELNRKLSEVETQNADCNRSLADTKRALQRLNMSWQLLDGAQESSAKQSHELRTQLRDLERQDANDTHKNDIHNLQVQMRDLEAVREGLQKQLAECRATGHRLEEDKENLEIRLSASSQEATDLKVRLVAWEEANKKRERETKALQERLVRLETANTKLQLEKEVLEDKLGMLRSQESQQEEERRALRHSLETVEQQRGQTGQ